MHGCVAPSEIPGITSTDAASFGAVAENIIFSDYCSKFACNTGQVFWDDNNPAAYLYFLASHNPHFTQARQTDYYARTRAAGLGRIPDIVIHARGEKAFYEIKPESTSGMRAGVSKVGIVSATYRHFDFPYRPGVLYTPKDHVVGLFGNALRAKLRVRRCAPGLIVYRLCLETSEELDVATLAVLLHYIVKQINKQRGSGRFRPIDLEPLLTSNRQLEDLGSALGIATGAAVATVGWSYFWKAVAKRFAVRGTAAATLAAADGPLPVGDLAAAGLALWTIVDIVRLRDELWRDAAQIASRGI